jgi:hypothetical protein
MDVSMVLRLGVRLKYVLAFVLAFPNTCLNLLAPLLNLEEEAREELVEERDCRLAVSSCSAEGGAPSMDVRGDNVDRSREADDFLRAPGELVEAAAVLGAGRT